MGALLCEERKCERIAIEYEGGSLTLRFEEYQQTLKLFSKVDHYSDHNVVVSSSAWFEMEQTIKRREHRCFVMLSNGEFMHIDEPTRDHAYGNACVGVKISDKGFD